MIDECCEAQAKKYVSSGKFHLIGVSDIRSGTESNVLTDGIARKLFIPSVTDTVSTVLNNLTDPLGKCSRSQILGIYNDVLDQIEVGLVIHQGGGVFNLTPLGMIAAAYFQMMKTRGSTGDDLNYLEKLIGKAVNLSSRFTHLVITFPFPSSDGYFQNSVMSNMIAGLHYRYEDKVGCPVIRIPEVIGSDEDRIDFASRIIALL